MQLIVMHDRTRGRDNAAGELLPFILATDPLAALVYTEHARLCGSLVKKKTVAVPHTWRVQPPRAGINIARYNGVGLGGLTLERLHDHNRWCIISNGRFVTHLADGQIGRVLQNRDGVVALHVEPSLRAYRESVCLGSRGHLAGFKRVYAHSVSPGFLGRDWPHHVCVRLPMLDKLLVDGRLPLEFDDFLDVCSRRSLACTCLNIGGNVLDLESEAGILSLFAAARRTLPRASVRRRMPGARLFGEVLMADDVRLGDKAVVVGPAMLANRCRIGSRAVVKNSIIAPGAAVPDDAIVQDRVITAGRTAEAKQPVQHADARTGRTSCIASLNGGYRIWPPLSYARFTKRIADTLFASAVLIAFAPVFPIIALMIKLNSPGPVFFKHKRQGLHGRPFNCLKFRTMIVRADVMQAKLRSKNHVDGPQFKIEDDPRVTTVGKFLRNTFLDEIPQFVNVLRGQMSVVGPRPSPEAENMLCPFWRDARLSVRPGVTGLWQVQRTRRFGQDFQEWIHYDTEYVRNMSWRQDVAICFKTAHKLIGNFFHHIQR